MSPTRLLSTGLLLAGLLLIAGCAGISTDPAGAGRGGDSKRLHLVASFYPLQWATQQVAGGSTEVDSLTKAGAEPHDLELTPQDVAKISDADLIVYVKGFQPAVDDAVAKEGGDHAFDVSRPADLSLTYTPVEAGQADPAKTGAIDPHFWLDPHRLAAVSRAIAARLSSLDPDRATRYAANAHALTAKLDQLDRDLRTGLATCADPDVVTTHNAFGYLARRYQLTQVGITGLTPEDEPRPSDLAAVTRFVREHHVRTIYYETLASPLIAKTVAAETGARTAVLDPIEGLTSASQGHDYLEIMRANLANLRAGQGCS